MIRYALRCAEGHAFESWFQSASAFDRLAQAGHLSCATCGGGGVEKALMAPRVASDGDAGAPAAAGVPADAASGALQAPRNPVERAIAELRRKVEANATYVGGRFAAEARAIHAGDKPDRPIWGEADPRQAKALIEDGVPVAPLPFRPKSKTN